MLFLTEIQPERNIEYLSSGTIITRPPAPVPASPNAEFPSDAPTLLSLRFFPNSACRGKMRGPKVCAETKKDYLCTTKCITHLFYKPDQPKATTEYREICRCFFMSKSFFRGRDCFLWRDPFRGHFFATQPFFGCIVFCAAALLRVLCFLCRDPFRRRGQNGYPTPKLRAVFFQRRLCIHLSPAGWLGLWICMPQSRRRMTNLMSRRRPNPVLNPSCL